jgi:hypothetical protein
MRCCCDTIVATLMEIADELDTDARPCECIHVCSSHARNYGLRRDNALTRTAAPEQIATAQEITVRLRRDNSAAGSAALEQVAAAQEVTVRLRRDNSADGSAALEQDNRHGTTSSGPEGQQRRWQPKETMTFQHVEPTTVASSTSVCYCSRLGS